jgi:hypothetical protein
MEPLDSNWNRQRGTTAKAGFPALISLRLNEALDAVYCRPLDSTARL